MLGERSYASLANDEAAARAAAAGLMVVMDACIAATHTLLRIPPKSAPTAR